MDHTDIPERIKSDFSLAYGDLCLTHGQQECNPINPVLVELHEAGEELAASIENIYHFEWNIVDVDECHIYLGNKANGHRYHISVIYPAALYVDVYRIMQDGTEVDAFA